MISKKELEYVSTWARKVPYPGYEYSRETLLKLKESVTKYNEIYSGTKYNISFSNSEEITLEILSSNIAHMLGIDHKELLSEYKTEFRTQVLGFDDSDAIGSYVLLNRVVECMDDVLKYEDINGNKSLNFYKIRVKCEIFEKMANLMNFNFGCINFDNTLYSSLNNVNFNSNAGKILFTQSNEPVSPYFMIGIKPTCDNKTNGDAAEADASYIVETVFAPRTPQRFFNGQEVVIPTQILFDKNDILTKMNATSDQKRKIISMYREIINLYNLNDRLNIYGDYMELLSQKEGFQKTIQRV